MNLALQLLVVIVSSSGVGFGHGLLQAQGEFPFKTFLKRRHCEERRGEDDEGRRGR